MHFVVAVSAMNSKIHSSLFISTAVTLDGTSVSFPLSQIVLWSRVKNHISDKTNSPMMVFVHTNCASLQGFEPITPVITRSSCFASILI